jgi:predicted nucleic acid-binding protein
MVKLELWNGALAKEMPELEALDRLVVALDITFHVWHSTYELARKARLRGKTFPAADLLIAACARTHGAEVLHKDRHFDQILAL